MGDIGGAVWLLRREDRTDGRFVESVDTEEAGDDTRDSNKTRLLRRLPLEEEKDEEDGWDRHERRAGRSVRNRGPEEREAADEDAERRLPFWLVESVSSSTRNPRLPRRVGIRIEAAAASLTRTEG